MLRNQILSDVFGSSDVDLETINQQFDEKFITAMEAEFKKLRDTDSSPTENWMTNNTNITKVLKDRFNIKVNVKLVNDWNAYVPFTSMAISKNNPLHSVYDNPWTMDKTGRKIIRDKKKFTIAVDLAGAKLYGDVTEVDHEIFMGRPIIAKGSPFTLREGVAIFMHEFGHIFTYYAALNHSAVGNFIVQDFADAIFEIRKDKQATVLVKQLEREVGYKDIPVEEIAKCDNVDQVRCILFVNHMENVRHALGFNPHDLRQCESQADMFASRFGYGKDIVTGLDRLHREYGGYPGYVGNVVMAIVGIAMTVLTGGVYAALMLLVTVSVPGDYKIYDDPAERFKAVRDEVIGRLKKAPNDKIKSALIDEVAAIDKIIADAKTVRDILEFAQNHLVPWFRGRYTKVKTQRLYQSLANSELNLAAAKLERLA